VRGKIDQLKRLETETERIATLCNRTRTYPATSLYPFREAVHIMSTEGGAMILDRF